MKGGLLPGQTRRHKPAEPQLQVSGHTIDVEARREQTKS